MCRNHRCSLLPPRRAAGWRGSMVSRSRARGSGTTRPATRSRATPPSGKIDSRTWVKRRGSHTRNSLCASPFSSDRGTISAQPAAGPASSPRPGYPSHPQASTAADAGWFPVKKTRVDVDGADDPGRAEADHGPVVASLAAAPGLPAVHHLAARAKASGLERRWRGRQQVLLLAERLVAGRHHAAAQPARGQVCRGQRRGGGELAGHHGIVAAAACPPPRPEPRNGPRPRGVWKGPSRSTRW